MIINHNLPAMNANRNMNINSGNASKSMQKLSSGLRINTASDDAAGLAISEKMRGQIRGLDQASANAQDSISMVQTAEGALNETTSILQRMRELAVQSGNDTATDSDRKAMQDETAQLKSEIDRISSTTEFNTKKLLNGSLSAATTAQGTNANSSVFKAATTAATAGTEKAGLAVSLSSATAGTTGTSFGTVSGDAIAERTVIQTGVNDTFKIAINGNAAVTVTLDPSTTAGYTRQQFVDAINTGIQKAVTTANWTNDFNKAVASLTSDNHLQINTVSTGSSSKYNIALTPVAAGNGALESMGYAATKSVITAGVNLSTSGLTVGANAKFVLTVGSKTTGDLDLGAQLGGAGTYTMTQVKAGMQTLIDGQFGAGNIVVGDDGQGHITLTSNIKTGILTTAKGSANDVAVAIFGGTGAVGATADSHSNNVTIKGVNTVNATTAGTYVSAGANDEFNISVDGGATQTIVLKSGNYATRQDLVNEVNNEINDNTNLVGKVTASLDNAGKVVFTSNSTGSSSKISITAPTSANESALGTLGYAGYAGQVTGAAATAIDLQNGVDLATNFATGSTKLTVTLGQKQATIDLAGSAGINTDAGASSLVSSRDAIVNALQSKLDTAFGKGAITVNTSTAASGADYLVLNSNSRGSVLKIDGGVGTAALFDSAATAGNDLTAAVSAAGTNVSATGTDEVKNTLSNSTLLTNLSDKDGNNLGLKSGNVIKISGTQNGDGFSTSLTVTDTTTIADVQNALRNLSSFSGATVALDATTGKLTISGASGSTKDISNLAFSAQTSTTDSTAIGSFNKQFATFDVTQKAADSRSDNSITTQIGANQGQTMSIDINDMGTKALKLQDIDISSQSGAETALSVIDNAIQSVSAERSKLGAYQNRLEHTINNLGTSSENLSSAESRIRDVDMAKEMSTYSKNNILSQAAQAMLAQANQQPQQVLQLLR